MGHGQQCAESRLLRTGRTNLVFSLSESREVGFVESHRLFEAGVVALHIARFAPVGCRTVGKTTAQRRTERSALIDQALVNFQFLFDGLIG